MNFKAFLKECRDKQILKMLSFYIVASWVLLQVLAITWKPIGLPENSITYFIILMLVGFPLYCFYMWKFRLSKIELEEIESEEEYKKKKSLFQKIFYSLLSAITILCAISIVLIVNNKFSKGIILPVSKEIDKIAVLKFGNNTGNPEYDIVGKMAADWIVHGITENQVAQVISPEIISNYSNIVSNQTKPEDDEAVLKHYFKPSKIITGNIYLEGNKMILQCTMTGSNINETLISFKNNECPIDKPLDCIEDLNQLIIGYLTTEDQPQLNLQEDPPKFEAYQNVLVAKTNFSDQEVYIDLLNKAIAIDDTYFEPKVLRISYYYNLGAYKKADSLRKAIDPSVFNNKRQRNLLNYYDALLHGKNDKTYNTLKKEYEIAPFDLQTNSAMMVLALQFVNHPREIDSIYGEISMDSMDFANCNYCQDRMYVKAYADIELKNYDEAIEILEPKVEIGDDIFLKKPLVAAYIRAGKTEKLHVLLNKLKLTLSPDHWLDLSLYIGNEYLLQGNKKEANAYFDQIISSNTSEDDALRVAKALFFKKDYKNSEKELYKLYKANPKDINIITMLAISSAKSKDQKKTDKLISELNGLRADFQFGSIDYAMAQYYASKNDMEVTFQYLMKAVAEGRLFKPNTFQNDPSFLAFINTKEFGNIMNFWK